MDISKASNFERFVYDLAGRDPAVVRDLWRQVETSGGFDLAGTPVEARLRDSGFVSGRSTHADRIATIRDIYRRHGVVIDPHTADGIKVGLESRDAGIPLICIETALPAKFAGTIREALKCEPDRPKEYAGLESRPQRFVKLPADANAVKAYIAEHAISGAKAHLA